MLKKVNSNSSGFTLVELLVSIAVGAIVVGSMTVVVTNYIHMGQRGRYMNTANAYVEAKGEELRNMGYNNLNLGTTNLASDLPSDLPRDKSGSMTITAPSTGLKQVDITIGYTDNGVASSFTYTTYLGELGVGQ